ncbi:saccharopine dehydrogenase NADP-binding domain-containing protein [Actinomadura hibisca]|uniref:saccharopine dehydrogenase NADP-binding domain-containing protein n=1 Tax=Actinomadura hibisca TaxID=68565 RepID=UPI000A484D37|nr:saccharopine dehydrogenase NADP-binding domain-containing protein [Actinomadura hibisca]
MRVLILGGYGAVGREAAAALLEGTADEVTVAGRDPAKARPVPGARALQLDLRDESALEPALSGVDAVLMCVDQDNARVARICLERGVSYVDVTASAGPLAEIERLPAGNATAVLSVGLIPGVSNLLARLCVERTGGQEVEIGVLLGSGEQHGAAAVGWTLDALPELGPSWRARFPPPYGTRTVHRFPFSDQHTLPRTLGVRARTGLCLDSRALTAALPRAARLLERPRARALAEAALAKVHVGGDGFAVTATAGGHTAAFSGRRQSRATGLAAAEVVRRLPELPAGVWHIEQAIEPAGFLAALTAAGFHLAHYDAG